MRHNTQIGNNNGVSSLWSSLSIDEANYSRDCVNDLSENRWAKRVIKEFEENGSFIASNRSKMFELRFARALKDAGIEPEYEVSGEQDSTIDFGFCFSNTKWLVELMRLEETEAIKNATCSSADDLGGMSIRFLYSDNDDPRGSVEGETLKAIERICQKCEKRGAPYKFPEPGDSYHVILVDFRDFDGDFTDILLITRGNNFVPPEERLYWRGRPIAATFDSNNNLRGANYLRERVHFIGFVLEESFLKGEFGNAIAFIANPFLIANAEQADIILKDWPLNRM